MRPHATRPLVPLLAIATLLVSLGIRPSAALAQETCSSPIDILAPGVFAGDTTTAVADYDPGQFGCTGADTSGPDHVYRYTPAADERVDLVLRALDTVYDPSLWVFTSCAAPEGTCIAGADRHGHPLEESLELLALLGGTTYFIVVDGYDDRPFGLPFGRYELELRASIPPDDCATARVVPRLPWADTLDGSAATAGLDPSPGCGLAAQNGADLIYRLEPPYPASVTVTLDPMLADASLYAVADCALPATSCLAGADVGGPGAAETITVNAGPGAPVYVVIDSAGGTLGEYEVSFTAGDVCADPVVVPAFPFVAEGDSVAARDDLNVDPVCTGFRSRSSDVVYALSSATVLYLDLSVEPIDLAYDTSLYVVSDCAAPSATCVAGADAGAEGAPETVRWLRLDPGVTLYAVVDSTIPFEAAPYRFRAERSVGAQLLAVRAGAGVRLVFAGNGPTFRITRADDPGFTVNPAVLDPAAPGPEFTDLGPGSGTVYYTVD